MGTVGDGEDTVGSRHSRHICMHGEEIVEPCADFRNEVCFEDQFDTTHGNFNEAACRANRWSDCIDQTEQEDCENKDKRDCYWAEGVKYDGSNSKTADQGSVSIAEEDSEKENYGIIKGGEGEGICLPSYPPGLEFWQESNADSICSLGNSRQTVHYKEDFFGNIECKENCDVLTGEWVDIMNRVCTSLGDCGNSENFVGVHTDKGIEVMDNGKKRRISQGIVEAAEAEGDGGFFGGFDF